MPKLTSWVMFLLVTELVSVAIEVPANNSTLAQSSNLGEQNSDFNLPLCYIRFENGSLINLHKLCGKKPLTSVNQPQPVSEIKNPQSGVEEDDGSELAQPTPASLQTPSPQPTPTTIQPSLQPTPASAQTSPPQPTPNSIQLSPVQQPSSTRQFPMAYPQTQIQR